jgi:hypothetical protein
MPLIYSSVSKGTLTVAEYAAFSGNFSSVSKEEASLWEGASEGADGCVEAFWTVSPCDLLSMNS